MTVPSEVSEVEYVGNGLAREFGVPFPFFLPEHLKVLLTPAGGTESILTLGVDYTVSGAGDDEGGTVTLVEAPGEGDALVIRREVPIVQTTAFRTQGSFSPSVHEDAFDYSRMVDQQLDRRISALEARGTVGDVEAGSGLYVSGTTWHVGAGAGIVVGADEVEVDFSDSAPATVTAGAGAGSSGTAVTASRSDHRHQVQTGTPGAIQIGDSAAEGVSNALARADHTHALAAPAAPVDVNKAPASAGVSTAPARADHKHDVTTAPAVSITDFSNGEGTATSLARSDHTHAHGQRGGGNLHAVATTGANGFMAAEHVVRLASMPQWLNGEVRTSNETPTPVVELPMDSLGENPVCVVIEGLVAAIADNGEQAAGYQLAGTFVLNGGNVTQVGATTAIATHEVNAAWDCAFAINGATVELQVTGAAGATIFWRAQLRVLAVSAG